MHGPPIVLRAQRPERQVSAPQHSLLVMQVPISARQQRLAPCAWAHIVPVTHIVVPGVQSPPAGVGVIPLTQVPAVHVRPVQQFDPAEQAVPAALHRWQVPPMHWKAALVQVLPAQQGCMSPPQVPAPIWQVRGMPPHISPGSHADVPQQG